MADGSLKLDEGVGLVVIVRGTGLTVGTEIEVVTDGTLVANAPNVRGVVLLFSAKRSVTADPHVNDVAVQRSNASKLLVDRDESVVRVNELGIRNAVATKVPVGAVQAFMTDTIDFLSNVSYCRRLGRGGITNLITSVANGRVLLVATSS